MEISRFNSAEQEERLLDVIPSTDDTKRLAIVEFAESRGRGLRLYQQSYSACVGWFSQSSVDIDESQYAMLKLLMSQQSSHRSKNVQVHNDRNVVPSIVAFAS